MATLQLDIPRLSSLLSYPETSVQDLLSAPTTELVESLFQKISARASEYEESQSERLKLEVELENAVRTGESKARALKKSVDKNLGELSKLRQQLQDEQSSKQNLEAELQALKSSTSGSSAEVSNLQARIASLESSNRDTVSLFDSKSAAFDSLATELSAKHQKTVELRREISTLEQSISSSNAAVSSAKFKEQSLQQEVESLNRSNDWLDQELKTKSAEYAKFRKEKSARIGELQRQNEDVTSSLESLQRTEQTLKTRLEQMNQKAEEYLAEMHELRDTAARVEEESRAEINTTNRLAELMKESADMERLRHQELSSQLEETKDAAAEELGKINAEIETEHRDREAAEQRVSELEVEVERLRADVLLHSNTGLDPGTPNGRRNGDLPGTPRQSSRSRIMSPMPSAIKGSISYTQLVSDYHLAKADLDAERRRNEKLSASIDDMIHDMETRQPQIAELQADHDRLETDIVEMSSLCDNIGKERDETKKEARKWERQVAGLSREGDILRQQLRDLSSQVKVLLMELNSQGQGQGAFTAEERSRLEALARGDMDDLSQDLTDTDIFISQNLTTFRGIAELQTQNERLLRLTRELGERMEGEEAKAEKNLATQNQEELEDLRQRFERSKDEIKVLVTQSQSYIRERDMFRRMLSHRGQLPPGSDLMSAFGESVNGSQAPATPSRNGLLNSIEQSPSSKDMADYAKLLKDMQSHFDSYKQEAASDRAMLKEELHSLNKKNSELRNDLSKKTSEVSLAVDRWEMLQGNYTMLKSENGELQKRLQTMSESAAKQDLRAQQIAEDFIEAKGLVESTRNETANLRAEKDFWKSVEKRLTEDNERLQANRDQLNTLNANLQNVLNEREHTGTESRRRLESQVETLESELQSSKRKLADEVEEGKRISQRREYENQRSQSRIDDLVASLGTTREELIAAKTARDHLQARVDELTIELRSAEERLEVLQPRRTSHALPANSDTNNTGADVGKEQELALEISELKRDIELAHAELSNAKVEAEQYKVISQSTEEQLQSLNETQDQYRQEMDQIIEEKDARVSTLEQGIDNLRAEISNVSSELLEVKASNSEHSHKMDEQKSSYENEIARLKDLNERTEAAAKYHREDLKAQAEIATQAQENYEAELLKHAEAARSLQNIRSEYNQVKLEIMELRSTSDASAEKLAQSEESWAETKDRYERELRDIKTRRDDASAQNKILYQQLETVSGQIADLQKGRRSREDGEDESTSDINQETGNLQELIKYLRREKEIVDVQFELSSQEAKRLRQQLDHTHTQLDEARLKLGQLRRSEENQERNALNHKKLMDVIEELNLNRESNATLRHEKTKIQSSLTDKLAKIEELQAEIRPLHARVRELEDLTETQEGDLRMTREARERFEQRYLDVLHRSDSIDPAEFEKLKERLGDLEVERDKLVVLRDELQEQVNGIPDKIKESLDQTNERHQESRSKLIEQSKAKARDQNAKIKDKDAALQNAIQEKQELESKLEALRGELEQANAAKEEAMEAAKNQSPKEHEGGQSHEEPEGGQVGQEELESSGKESQALQEQLHLAQSVANTEAARSTKLQGEVTQAQSKVSELQNQLLASQRALDQANSRISSLQAERLHKDGAQNESTSSQEIESLRQDVSRLENESEQLRTNLSVHEHSAKIQSEGESITDQIAHQVEAIRLELTSRHEERIRQAEELFAKRAQNMKEAFNKNLRSLRVETQQTCEASNAKALEALNAKHGSDIDALNNRHRAELEELRQLTKKPSGTTESAGKSDVSVQVSNEGLLFKDSEIKEFLQKNEFARRMMQNSLANREKKVREEQQQILAAKLAEAEAKANTAKEQAVSMEGKRFSVKMSMTENRAKLGQAKVEVVQKAASDTPQRPVSEVWAIAKDVKLVSAANASVVPRPLQNQSNKQGSPPVSTPVSTPSRVNPFVQRNQQPSPSGTPTQPVSTQNEAAVPTTSFGQPSKPPLPNTTDQEQPNSTTSPAPPSQDARRASASLSKSIHASNAEATQAPSSEASTAPVKIEATVEQTTRLPDKPLRDSRPTGPAPTRGPQSGLPIPSGGRGGGTQQGRGASNIGRGRGRGNMGRGGMPSINTNNPSGGQQTQGSPRGTAPFNATAKQFVPQKRARDDGLEASQHANEGKRQRGGGGQFSG